MERIAKKISAVDLLAFAISAFLLAKASSWIDGWQGIALIVLFATIGDLCLLTIICKIGMYFEEKKQKENEHNNSL